MNSNNSIIPNTITSSAKSTKTPSLSNNYFSSESSIVDYSGKSFFDKLKNVQWYVWIILLFFLAYLGFNIFTYLGNITNWLIDSWNNFISWVNSKFGTNFSQLAKQTINISATGAKGAIDVVQQSSNQAIDYASQQEESQQGIASATPVQEPPPQQIDNIVQNGGMPSKNSDDVDAAPAFSSVGETGQAGWCYIGEDQGTRTCAKVGRNDVCMSGDIFPTQDVCINPNLRA